MVKGDWIKEGAVVIDVGINSVEVCPIIVPVLLDGVRLVVLL
jgi:5,10-methylene-tetrahydrofolate dehydrogenase/methenyl tetrahydrofolate cyclohydrolase